MLNLNFLYFNLYLLSVVCSLHTTGKTLALSSLLAPLGTGKMPPSLLFPWLDSLSSLSLSLYDRRFSPLIVAHLLLEGKGLGWAISSSPHMPEM